MKRMRWTARAVATGLAAAVVMSVTVGPAEAALSRTYGKSAVIQLVEMGPMAGAPGNVHYGYLSFYSFSTGDHYVLGYIFHAQCPEGFTPTATDVYADVYDEIESSCQVFNDGSESLESGDLTIKMTKDQTWTHVSGYFDSSLSTQPQVAFSLSLRGVGEVTESESVTRQPRSKTVTTLRVRAATVKGQVGGLGIADEADDLRFAGQVSKSKFKTFSW